MAIVNRRSGTAKGGVKIFQLGAAQIWKGLQVVRDYSGWIGQTPSKKNKALKAKEAFFAARFRHDLTVAQQNLWNQFAGTLGSAVDREKSDNVALAKNIIPKRRKLMTGLDAYVGLNLAAHQSGMMTPLDTPPYGEATPPPPIDVDVTYAGGTATVTWTDPTLVGTPMTKIVRVWAKLLEKGNHVQIVGFLTIPSTGSFTFTELRSGHAHNSPKIMLSQLGTANLAIQMDTIAARTLSQAPLIGPSSNVAVVKIQNP